nr:threonine/serine dehydratase [Sphingomicrobium nitratireducens]
MDAARRIDGAVRRTPLTVTAIGGAPVAVKWENRQEGGAFKLRGASNRLLAMSEAERAGGVVAFSSGNHARGVAIAARRLGMTATIVMPSDAPQVKIDATRAEGAEIVLYDRRSESREEIAARLAVEQGATLVPSFDDPYVVAGQGTVGLELAVQAAEIGHEVRRILVCCGGGGLSAGIALACPDAEIVTVEPEGWDDMARSYEAGDIVPVADDAPDTLCDALQTPRVSPITFGILQERGAKGVAVSEEWVRAAVRYAHEAHGETVEPGGAVALAALLSGVVEPRAGDVAIVSGGNVDPALHARLVA